MNVAEEVHASPLWAIVLAVPGIVMVAVAASSSAWSLRMVMSLAAVIMFGAVVLAWSGFRYVFTNSGLEIRTLGFTLRSIRTDEIRDYRIDKWNVAGGYGIRGLGADRAYVWGSRGVRITTAGGQVFLGSSDPQKIIRDLDQITNQKHSYPGPEEL
jgi:hypothetical protein